MLKLKRFDYFPRGINEAWNEIDKKGVNYPELMVEERTALYYPYPVYYFVNKENRELAARIEKGLKIALADGSFKDLFFESHSEIINKANLDDRIIFKLQNPTLPEGTPEPDTSWWLNGK